MDQCFIFLEGIKRAVENVDREGSYGVTEVEGEENQKVPFNLALSSVLMTRVAQRIAHLQVEQSRTCSRVVEIYKQGTDSRQRWRAMAPLIDRSREIIREVEDLKLHHKQLLIGFLFLNEYLRRTVDPDFERADDVTNSDLYRRMEEELFEVLQSEASTIFDNSYDDQVSLHDFFTRKFPYPIKDKAVLSRLEALMEICVNPFTRKGGDHPFSEIASTLLDTEVLQSDVLQLGTILSEVTKSFLDLFPEQSSGDKIREISPSSLETAGKGGVLFNYDANDTLPSDLTDFICYYLMLMAFTFADADPLFQIFAQERPFIQTLEVMATMPLLLTLRYATKIVFSNPVTNYAVSAIAGSLFAQAGGASLYQGIKYYFGYNPGWLTKMDNVQQFIDFSRFTGFFSPFDILGQISESQTQLNAKNAQKMVRFFLGDGVWEGIVKSTLDTMKAQYLARRLNLAEIKAILTSGLEGSSSAFGGFKEYLTSAKSNGLVNWIHALSSPYGAMLLYLSWGIVTSGSVALYLLNGRFDSSELVYLGLHLHEVFIIIRQTLWIKIVELYLSETFRLEQSTEVTTDEVISDALFDMLRTRSSSVQLEYQPLSGYVVPVEKIAESTSGAKTTRQASKYEKVLDNWFWYGVSFFADKGGTKLIYNYGEMTAMQMGIRDYVRILNSLFGGSLSSLLPQESTSHFDFISLKTMFDLVARKPHWNHLTRESNEKELKRRRFLYRKRMAYQAVLQGMTLLNDLVLMLSLALVAGMGAMNLSGSFPIVGQSGGNEDIASHPLQTAVGIRVGYHVLSVTSSFFATSGLSVFMKKDFTENLAQLALFQGNSRVVSYIARTVNKNFSTLGYGVIQKIHSLGSGSDASRGSQQQSQEARSVVTKFDDADKAAESVLDFWVKMTGQESHAIYAPVPKQGLSWETWSDWLATTHGNEIDELIQTEVQAVLVTGSYSKEKQMRVANSLADKLASSCSISKHDDTTWYVKAPAQVGKVLTTITGARFPDADFIGKSFPDGRERTANSADTNTINGNLN